MPRKCVARRMDAAERSGALPHVAREFEGRALIE